MTFRSRLDKSAPAVAGAVPPPPAVGHPQARAFEPHPADRVATPAPAAHSDTRSYCGRQVQLMERAYQMAMAVFGRLENLNASPESLDSTAHSFYIQMNRDGITLEPPPNKTQALHQALTQAAEQFKEMPKALQGVGQRMPWDED